jgi:hypothetical protein
LLDTAVAGTTSITTDADITLTTTTGASNQARQAIILWNPASGTVTRNITAPAQSKIYTVINASGGTQSIVIRGVGPTTGVTIVKGESAQVAWNGTDFVKVSSNSVFGPITVTNLTVTGNTILGDASADTVTVNGTITSNLIFTDNTYDIGASGATRPRNLFVAGNATFGSLTTGRVVYTSTGGILASSSNLLYAGTDLSNLNGDIIIGNSPSVTTRMFRAIEVGTAGNNAGIAFSTNGGKGAIYGQSGSANLSIVSGNSGAIAFGYSTGNADASANFISLGAWTTTGLGVNTASPLSQLDVRAASATMGNYQTIQAFSTNTATIDYGGGISLGGYYSGTSSIAQFASIVGRKENGTAGNYAGYLAFGTNSQATGVREVGRFASTGYFGIACPNPQADLQIGNVDASARDIVMHTINNGNARLRFREGGTISSGYNEYSFGMVGSDNAMTWNVQGYGEVGRWSGVGYLGIGNSSPGAFLDVGPTASASIPAAILRGGSGLGNTGGLGLYTNDVSATARNWGVVSNSSAYGDFSIRQGNSVGANPLSNGTDRFYISNTGYIGINQTSPADLLHMTDGTLRISGTTAKAIYIYGAPSVKPYIDINEYGVSDYYIGAGTSAVGVLSIGASLAGTAGVHIKYTNGYFGIGLTDPQTLVHMGQGTFGLNSPYGTASAVPAFTSTLISGEIHAGATVGSGSDGGVLRISAGGETSASAAQKSGMDFNGYNTTDGGPRIRMYAGSSSPRVMINQDGNVMVAVLTPYNSAKLSVAGDIEARGNVKSYQSSRGGLASGASVNLLTLNTGSYGTAISLIAYVQQRNDNAGSLSNYQYSITGWGGSGATVTTSSSQSYGGSSPLTVTTGAASGNLTITLTNASGSASTTLQMNVIVLIGYESINWGW